MKRIGSDDNSTPANGQWLSEVCDIKNCWDQLRRMYDPPLMSELDFGSYMDKIASHALTYRELLDGVVAGMVSFYANDTEVKEAFITQLAVNPNYCGRGIGKSLIERAVEESKARGMRTIALEVKNANERAIGLYTKCGFRAREVKADSWIMSRSIV